MVSRNMYITAFVLLSLIVTVTSVTKKSFTSVLTQVNSVNKLGNVKSINRLGNDKVGLNDYDRLYCTINVTLGTPGKKRIYYYIGGYCK